jgi:hypothetical protein
MVSQGALTGVLLLLTTDRLVAAQRQGGCDARRLPLLMSDADAACPNYARRECSVECAMAMAPLQLGGCRDTVRQTANASPLLGQLDAVWAACLRGDDTFLRELGEELGSEQACPGFSRLEGNVHDGHRRNQAAGNPIEELLAAYVPAEASGRVQDPTLCALVAPYTPAAKPPPTRPAPPPCVDDPEFTDALYGNDCMGFATNREYCTMLSDARGRTAAEACPTSCGSGCALTYDNCWDNPCENGGVCVDAINEFGCRCPAGFCGTHDCSISSDIRTDHSGQCPCEDDPDFRDVVYGVSAPCSMFAEYLTLCESAYDSMGRLAAEACPETCNTGCALSYDDCATTPCQNGGQCRDGVGFPICDCPAHLASNDEGDTCTDECAGRPCLNGGVCTDGIDDYSCACPEGYGGNSCELEACTSCTSFPGSHLLDATAEANLVRLLPTSVRRNRWALCYSSMANDDPLHVSDPTNFHNDCDAYSTTVVIVHHDAVPDTDMQGLSAGPAWEEGASWLFGGVAFGSWSYQTCCDAGPPNTCGPPSQRYCFDQQSSDNLLFRLAPGSPQSFPTTGGNNYYQTTGPAYWPSFGYGADLAIGDNHNGHCAQGSTYTGVENEMCGGHEDWTHGELEVWRPA